MKALLQGVEALLKSAAAAADGGGGGGGSAAAASLRRDLPRLTKELLQSPSSLNGLFVNILSNIDGLYSRMMTTMTTSPSLLLVNVRTFLCYLYTCWVQLTLYGNIPPA